MADSITFTINSPTYPFNGVPFQLTINIDSIVRTVDVHPGMNSTTVTVTNELFIPSVTSGLHTLSFIYRASATGISPLVDTSNVASIAFSFNDNPATTGSQNISFTTESTNFYYTDQISITFSCLHGDSVITTTNGKKFIKDANEGDKVLTANGEYAEIINVSHCWLKDRSTLHDAVIFEPYSLTSELPTERLIIDPAHPIKINKDDEFRPAGYFVTGDKIHVCKWVDEIIQGPTPSRRWDLVLEDGYDNYIANGVIVKSRLNISNAGYKYQYKKWT